jgi:hypothetical protein
MISLQNVLNNLFFGIIDKEKRATYIPPLSITKSHQGRHYSLGMPREFRFETSSVNVDVTDSPFDGVFIANLTQIRLK